MEYRLKPEAPDLVTAVGGIVIDDKGWLLQTTSKGDPCLVVRNTNGAYALLGVAWVGFVELDGCCGGWEGYLGKLLTQWGTEAGDDAMKTAGSLAAARANSAKADAAARALVIFKTHLAKADEVMAVFLGTAPTEGEPYTDEAGQVWHRLAGYEKMDGQRMDDQLLSRCREIFTENLTADLFNRYVYPSDGILREFDGGLYVRDNAAEVLGWDYTLDLNTMTFATVNGWDTVTGWGTAHGDAIQWHFYVTGDGDGTYRFIHYYSLGAESWPADAELTVRLNGEWYGVFRQDAPPLGAPLAGEMKNYEDVPDGIYWFTETWDGLEIGSWINETTGVRTVNSITVTSPNYPNWRGIRVGSTRDQVLNAYPEIDTDLQGQVNGSDTLSYGPGIGADVRFTLEKNVVTQIHIAYVSD